MTTMSWRGLDVVVLSLPTAPAMPLSAAEEDISRMIAQGLSNQAIARQRGTSERTVANQIASLLAKLRLPSRHHVAARRSLPPSG